MWHIDILSDKSVKVDGENQIINFICAFGFYLWEIVFIETKHQQTQSHVQHSK